MPTSPVTYRVSPEVDTELKRLAETHGGVDKALRVLFGWNDPDIQIKPATEITDRQRRGRQFKGPIPRPKDQKK